MPTNQALIDLLAPAISASNIQQTHRNFDVDYDQLRQILSTEAAGVSASRTRTDTGVMAIGQSRIDTHVLIGGHGDITDGIPDGTDVSLIPDPVPTAAILIAFAGNGDTPSGRGGDASVTGGFECVCIAIGGHAGSFVLPPAGSDPGAPGGAGPRGGDAQAQGPDGAELWSIGGTGGKGGTGRNGSKGSFQIVNVAAVTPRFRDIHLPGRGGDGGPGGRGGTAVAIGGPDNGYVRAIGGNGGEAGDGGIGGPSLNLPTRAPQLPQVLPAGPPGQFGRGGAGGSTCVFIGPNGYREVTPGAGGPGAIGDPNSAQAVGADGVDVPF